MVLQRCCTNRKRPLGVSHDEGAYFLRNCSSFSVLWLFMVSSCLSVLAARALSFSSSDSVSLVSNAPSFPVAPATFCFFTSAASLSNWGFSIWSSDTLGCGASSSAGFESSPAFLPSLKPRTAFFGAGAGAGAASSVAATSSLGGGGVFFSFFSGMMLARPPFFFFTGAAGASTASGAAGAGASSPSSPFFFLAFLAACCSAGGTREKPTASTGRELSAGSVKSVVRIAARRSMRPSADIVVAHAADPSRRRAGSRLGPAGTNASAV
mmetsp:Transcript_38559/g.77280  ORF Transcript_38559/g.77280 Transcript_38559/m.77280 type:complete len:267 (+) Transcript_38559:33-833(+)